MNFRPRHREEPDLNLIPMIDVLIVLLIFLLLTTTFSREAQLHISLPDAAGAAGETGNGQAGVQIVINAQGQYRINILIGREGQDEPQLLRIPRPGLIQHLLQPRRIV